MADLSIYKVNLDTPQPNGKQGESPRNAFTKYNSLVDKLDDKYLDKDNNLSELSNKSTSRTNLGLGTAATRDVTTSTADTTSGRLLKVKDFGLGTTEPDKTPDDDIDNPEIPSGFYNFTAGSAGTLPAPNGALIQLRYSREMGGRGAQIIYRTNYPESFSIRNLYNAEYGEWLKIFTEASLGTSGKKLFYAEDLYAVAKTTAVVENGNVGYGSDVFRSSPTGGDSTAFGHAALREMTSGHGNTSFGRIALRETTTGLRNTAVGLSALQNCSEGSYNSALGWKALSGTTDYTNCTGIGREAEVTGSYQIQLGHSGTTVYAYGAVQDRSDRRDKTDIRDTQLGLTFVNALRPVDYRWDMRDDYRPAEPEYPAEPELEDFMPTPVDEASFGDDEEALNLALQTYEQAKQQAELDYEQAYDAWKLACKPIREQWLEDCKLGNIVTDGTHKRSRYHHGLIADEVKQVMDNLGLDFGGYQDHSINGGDDVLSIGYAELIAPMIKAIQELSAKVEALENQNE